MELSCGILALRSWYFDFALVYLISFKATPSDMVVYGDFRTFFLKMGINVLRHYLIMLFQRRSLSYRLYNMRVFSRYPSFLLGISSWPNHSESNKLFNQSSTILATWVIGYYCQLLHNRRPNERLWDRGYYSYLPLCYLLQRDARLLLDLFLLLVLFSFTMGWRCRC